MSDHPRYAAHARRIEMLRQVSHDPLADYYAGYRAGMIRWRAGAEDGAPSDPETRARARRARTALRGTEPDLARLAWSCGYHDGQQWEDVGQHRGLLRLAITVTADGSARGFARTVWHVHEASVRQMLAGTRPIPAPQHAALLDLLTPRE